MAIQFSNIRKFTKKQYRRAVNSGFDFNMLIVMLFIIAYGLIMIYSAGSKSVFTKQLVIDIGSLAVMAVGIFVLGFPKIWGVLKSTPLMIVYYVIAIVPLFLVPIFGTESHGATRWIKIGGMSIQPAEFTKTAMILFMAVLLIRMKDMINTWKGVGIALFFVLWPVLFVFVLTKNLSSAIIIAFICCAMIFVASDDYKKYIILIVGVAVLAAIVIIYVANADMSDGKDFRFGRIYNWIHPGVSADSDSSQTMYGLYAIGNGGIVGKGLGESVMKYKLPEATNDMIFTVICEELGLVGALALIIMYMFFLYKMYALTLNTKNRFGLMVVAGVLAHIGIQAVLNIAVATNSMPNTGVSLPFISTGGSSILTLLIEMAFVFAVNRINTREERAAQ